MPRAPSSNRLRTQFDVSVRRTSHAIGIPPKTAERLLRHLNSQSPTRSLEFQDDNQQLTLLRLEVLRLKISRAMAHPSRRPQVPMPDGDRNQVSDGLPPNQELPNGVQAEVRTRSVNLSESEISVLDIGPSLQSTQTTATASTTLRRTSTHQSAVMSNGSPNLTAGPDRDGLYREHASQLDVQTIDTDSVAITSTAGSVIAGIPLSLRERRHAVIDIPHPLRRPPGPGGYDPNDASFASSQPSYTPPWMGRYGYGFDGYVPAALSLPDEPDLYIPSRSLPHSPQSPSVRRRPPLPRSQSSFGGMDPEFAAMQNIERMRAARNDKPSEASSSAGMNGTLSDEEEP
ncbi:unnamed protein product [Penicillium olsonii]|uniref:Uncharacterized protein n=1 Tax=Penicillium olsonii TaxID=99116 RepID=A0A9W4HUR8_PENOL|nr:unnamed protein product [Penicillium olsonii]CAG8167146.1 unnamed protein product [Penicillium olsonii]